MPEMQEQFPAGASTASLSKTKPFIFLPLRAAPYRMAPDLVLARHQPRLSPLFQA
jgi:hypothetical protein